MYFSNLASGAVHPEAIYVTRVLILLAFWLQIPDSYPSILIPAFLFFTAFCFLLTMQYFVGPRMLEGWVIGSVNREATFSSLIQLLFYFLFFLSCLKLTSRKETIERLGSALSILVFVITVWGIVGRVLGKGGFGPFVNENHFGGFAALTLPLVLQGAFYRFYRLQKESRNALNLLASGVVFFLFVVALVLAGCFLSQARSATLVIFLIFLGSIVLFAFQTEAKGFAWILVLVLGGSFLISQKLGWNGFLRTFDSEQLKNAWMARQTVTRESIKILFQFPFFGCGLGSYSFLSPKFVTVSAGSVVWDHAHNDYVELLAETGVVGFVLFLSVFLSLLYFAAKGYAASRSRWVRSLFLESVISLSSLGILELTDFHLKIPSLALLFTFQLALLFQSSQFFNKEKESRRVDFSSVKSFWRVTYATVGILLFVSSTRDLLAHSLSQKNGNRLEGLQMAVKLNPLNSEYWHQLGLESLAGASHEQAISALKRALRLSPTSAHYWYSLGQAEYSSGYKDQGIASLEKAVAWSPANPIYAKRLNDLKRAQKGTFVMGVDKNE